jgi:hypothetical protein
MGWVLFEKVEEMLLYNANFKAYSLSADKESYQISEIRIFFTAFQ